MPVPCTAWIPSPIFPFRKTMLGLEGFPYAEFPPGLTRLMSPLCNSGLSRSNSPDLHKAVTAENWSNTAVSHTQAALHVEGFWMCPKSNQWMLLIFTMCWLHCTMKRVQYAKVHIKNLHKTKKLRVDFDVHDLYRSVTWSYLRYQRLSCYETAKLIKWSWWHKVTAY